MELFEAGASNLESEKYFLELISAYLNVLSEWLQTDDIKIKFLKELNKAMISRFQKFKSSFRTDKQKGSKIFNDFLLYSEKLLKVLVKTLSFPGTRNEIFELLKNFLGFCIKSPIENKLSPYFNRPPVLELMETEDSSKLTLEEEYFFPMNALLLAVYSDKDVSPATKEKVIEYFSIDGNINILMVMMMAELICVSLEKFPDFPLNVIIKVVKILFNLVPPKTIKFSQPFDGYEKHSNLENEKIFQNNMIKTITDNTIADKKDEASIKDSGSNLGTSYGKIKEAFLSKFFKYGTNNDKSKIILEPGSFQNNPPINKGFISSKENNHENALLSSMVGFEKKSDNTDPDLEKALGIFYDFLQYTMYPSQNNNIMI